MKRGMVLALCVLLIQGVNLSAIGAKQQAASGDSSGGSSSGDSATRGVFPALPGVPVSL
ncbi:MAG: hypothetical protein LBE17_12485 [Treponema sp.]|jgi:hypothetical protein|nr:hypothetical protein [Treponema sp.]